jgi:hypothetical protein
MNPMSWRRLLIRATVLLVLAAVFMAYQQPQLMLQLSEQLWSCF